TDLSVRRRHVGHERLRARRQAAAPACRLERLGVRNQPDRRRRTAVRVRSRRISERVLADHGSQADLTTRRIRPLEQPYRGGWTRDPARRQRQRPRNQRRRRHLPPSGALVVPFANTTTFERPPLSGVAVLTKETTDPRGRASKSCKSTAI